MSKLDQFVQILMIAISFLRGLTFTVASLIPAQDQTIDIFSNSSTTLHHLEVQLMALICLIVPGITPLTILLMLPSETTTLV